MPRRDALFLSHMLAAIDRLAELMARTDRETFDGDWVIQNAVIRELEVLGEAAGRMSTEFVASHAEIPWREITGIRHKLIHGYFAVDLGVVWKTATENVPGVADSVRAAARERGPPSAPGQGTS
jgi:uncharacterized protein with HEPN domain